MTTPELATQRFVDLGGDVAWIDFGGAAAGPLIVGVHGLGGASWNWAALAPLLTPTARFIAIDLAGHGLTRSLGRATTVGANRRLLDAFLGAVTDEPVVLVGNSMGGAISLLEGARAPERVKGIVLIDPALPRPALARIDPQIAATFAIASLPVVGKAAMRRRATRRGVEGQVRDTLKLCTVDFNRIPAAVIDTGVAVSKARAEDPAARVDFLNAARSVVRLLARPGPLQSAAVSVTAAEIPVLLLHGDHDRLVGINIARRFAAAHPTWQFEVAENIGHVPMLEDAEWTATKMLSWLSAATPPAVRN